MVVFAYAQWCENNWKANLANLTSYEPFTTFFSDLSIAEFVDGEKGVKETYDNVTKHWLSDYKYFTEFIVCLNHKSWEMKARMSNPKDPFTPEKCEKLCELYSDLYYKAQDKFYEKWDGNEEATSYYFNVTD